MTVAQESIVINAPVAELYARWLCFEDLPQFIRPLRNVQRIDETHFSFTFGGNGTEERSVLEVMFRNPERRIAWRILSGGLGLGVVSFEPQSDGSTEVTLKLRSAFNPLLSGDRAAEYLSELKSLMET